MSSNLTSQSCSKPTNLKLSTAWTEIINQQLWAELSYQEKTELDCLIRQIQADALRWAATQMRGDALVFEQERLLDAANQLDPKPEG